jgi:hypothetical protein
MTTATRTLHLRAGLKTVLWGMLVGVVILGVGGRVAMRGIALATVGAGGFSVGGTMTVLFLGLVSGAAGGLILFTARSFFHRWPPLPTLAYWGALVFLAFRGLHPVDTLRLALFLPLIALYGLLLQWRTWRYRCPLRFAAAAP